MSILSGNQRSTIVLILSYIISILDIRKEQGLHDRIFLDGHQIMYDQDLVFPGKGQVLNVGVFERFSDYIGILDIYVRCLNLDNRSSVLHGWH